MKKIFIMLILVFTTALTSCHIVSVSENVNFPSEKFEKVRKKIAKLKNDDSDSHKLRMLVYDGDSRELVKINVPKWLANMGLNLVDDDVTKVKIEGNVCDFGDLVDNLPKGMLMEVEDYEENTHVLMWIE